MTSGRTILNAELLEILAKQFKENKDINALLDKSPIEIKNSIKQLVTKGEIERGFILDDPNMRWSLFIQFGLLNYERIQHNLYKLSIPNETVKYFLCGKVKEWEKSNVLSNNSFFKSALIGASALLGGVTYGVGGVLMGAAAGYLIPKGSEKLSECCKKRSP